jgi:Heparinase II/III-like protein/Heparinase II/III N-terminus
LPQARLWDDFCRKSLEREIVVQIHDEGADFESAVPYHRLVTELFLASARLAQFQGRPLSANYHERLCRMVDFLAGVQRPDGLMPVIGDNDDGRFHIATRYGDWNRQDARHIFAPAAKTLDRPDWLRLAGDDGRWEAAWWGFDPSDVATGNEPAPDTRTLYPDLGVAVTRTGGHYLAITNGAVGTKGFGNHKHNELLGFEYHVDGVPLIVDAGSFVYTSDFAARNAFRSTAYHNTVRIDGAEQNETNPEWIFRLFESANPTHETFEETDGSVTYLGSHTGYQRIEAKATHKRCFTYRRATGHLSIDDRITGEGQHELAWHFHAAPGVRLSIEADAIILANGAVRVRLSLPAGLAAEISDAWYSPSYGVRLACQAIELKATVPLDGRSWRFDFTPTEPGLS